MLGEEKEFVLTSEANKRAKERFKKHGPEFLVLQRRNSVVSLEGQPGFMLASVKTDWSGWFVQSHVKEK